MYVLSHAQNSHVRYASLYIHSFPLCAPRKILEATQFHQQYHSYREIQNIPDRLRWCRHSKGLRQKDAAEKLGISLSTYKSIEEGFNQYVSQELTQKLAQFYNVPVADLQNEYNRFLCDGQAYRIRRYRESLGLGKKPFARAMGIPIRSLQEWENERKVISYKSWERYFKGRE